MKDTLLVAALCLVVLSAGAFLFLKGEVRRPIGDGPVAFSVVAEGQKAAHVQERVNYRIKSTSEFSDMWYLLHGGSQPNIPAVDFERNEVLAIFDGSHTTGGYDVRTVSIVDSGLVRTITIEHTEPGEECTVSQGSTSPYELIVVPKMRDGHRLERVNTTTVTSCE